MRPCVRCCVHGRAFGPAWAGAEKDLGQGAYRGRPRGTTAARVGRAGEVGGRRGGRGAAGGGGAGEGGGGGGAVGACCRSVPRRAPTAHRRPPTVLSSARASCPSSRSEFAVRARHERWPSSPSPVRSARRW